MIGIIDYGLGNINAFYRMLNEENIKSKIIKSEEEFKNCSHLILPGVGSFDDGMNKLESESYFNQLKEDVIVKEKPILGVCIAMHLFCKKSDEGTKAGLGFVDAEVKKILPSSGIRVPHMGWNEVQIKNNCKIFNGIDCKEGFYFLHSYIIEQINENEIIAETFFGKNFISGFNKNNIFGFQFHPEKSHSNGRKLLKNFSEI